MNAYLTSAIVIFGTYAAAADVAQLPPKPRLRLDPVTRTAVAATDVEPKPQAQVTVMDKVVVKERSIPMERQKEQPYEGRFSAQQGGRVVNGGGETARWELGVWPSIDLTLTDSGMRPRGEPRLNVDFVKIKF